MKDIILTVLTSEGCGHCHHLRGDGEIGNGKQFMNYDFIKNHIDPLQNGNMVKLWNIHFSQMTGKLQNIMTVSKIYLENNLIHQEKYYNNNGKVNVKILTMNNNNNKQILKEDLADVKENWFDFILQKIPKSIENYTYFFPCFVVFEYEDWKNKDNILGITNAGFTMRDSNGSYMLEKNGQTLSQRNVLPQQLITEIMSGKVKFEPHKNFYEEPVAEKKEPVADKKEPVAEKKEPVKTSRCKFVIKNYDDDD